MFCDLADSTALSVKLGPEDLREVISTYQNTCTALIKKYDGYITRFMGDGILIYFGYPIASEDATERAVHSGLEIITVIQEIEPAENFELQVRLGIATGFVVSGDITGEGAAEEYTRDEPLPWINLIISRGRALSAIYQNSKIKKCWQI